MAYDKKKKFDKSDKDKNFKPRNTVNAPGLGSISGGAKITAYPLSDVSTAVDLADVIATHFLVDCDLDFDLVVDLIQQVINQLGTAKGYTSTVTVADVTTFIQNSFEAYISLKSLKLSQDTAKLYDRVGNDIFGVVNGLPNSGYSSRTIVGLSGTTNAFTSMGTSSISNAVWARVYLSELPKLFLTPSLKQFADHMFGNIFINPWKNSGSNLIRFWGQGVIKSGSVTDPTAAFATYIGSLTTAINTFPDLLAIMRMLGFSNDLAINENFTRDLMGNTINPVLDSNLKSMLANSLNHMSDITSVDYSTEQRGTIFVPEITTGVQMKPEAVSLDADYMFYSLVFRNSITPICIGVSDSLGTVTNYKHIPAAQINDNGLVLTVAGVNVIEKATSAMNFTTKYTGDYQPYDYIVYAGDVDIAISVNGIVGGSRSFDVSQKYFVGEQNIIHLTEVAQVEMILGKGYRPAIQKRLASMPTISAQ